MTKADHQVAAEHFTRTGRFHADEFEKAADAGDEAGQRFHKFMCGESSRMATHHLQECNKVGKAASMNGDRIIDDGVHAIYPKDAPRMVLRAGQPDVSLERANVAPEFQKVFGDSDE